MWGAADLIPTKEEWYKALEGRHGAELQKKFSSATVAVCGLGGLGSNIALCLARAGIKRVGDSFKKIVVVKDNIIPWHDDDGIFYIGIEQFLLDENSMDM